MPKVTKKLIMRKLIIRLSITWINDASVGRGTYAEFFCPSYTLESGCISFLEYGTEKTIVFPLHQIAEINSVWVDAP